MPSALVRQYSDLKTVHSDSILLFRVGEFYETFGADAILASRLLEITLTSRDGEPLAGIPARSAHTYLRRLTDKGYRVAIAEQLVDPASVRRGLVPRGVVEVLTPACHPDSALDAPVKHCFLTALVTHASMLATASIDVTTLDLRLEWTTAEDWPDMAASIGTREIILAPDAAPALALGLPCTRLAPTQSPSTPLDAATAMLKAYLERVQPAVAASMPTPVLVEASSHLLMDMSTRRSLELVHAPNRSLADIMDHTKTAFGSRLLTDWLYRPLSSAAAIRLRLRAVDALCDHTVRAALQEALSEVRDIERIAARALAGSLTPREMAALRTSLAALPRVNSAVHDHPALIPFLETPDGVDTHALLYNLLADSLLDSPAMTISDGPVVRQGYDAELDELRSLETSADAMLSELQSRERAQTGISSLKVGHTGPFGHHIEVTRTHLAKVPAYYTRRQTLTSAERFTTPELETLSASLSTAASRARARETEILAQIRAAISGSQKSLKQTTSALAKLDVLASMAHLAVHNNYTAPDIVSDPVFTVTAMRHPIVEATTAMGSSTFVPNDLNLTHTRTLLVTGPNMGGKSTYLRSAALMVVMSHAGSFVPAQRATIGIVDRLALRVGASDNLAAGDSTFMVEMKETAAIMRDATARSFVVLDEVGRGTATQDGLAISQAVLEGLAQRGCRTLFATHFHELQDVADTLPHTQVASLAVEERQGAIYFLHHVQLSRSDNSYGLHVAQLAGMPGDVLARARDLMNTHSVPHRHPDPPSPAVDLSFLLDYDPWDLTPRQALELIARARTAISSPQEQ